MFLVKKVEFYCDFCGQVVDNGDGDQGLELGTAAGEVTICEKCLLVALEKPGLARREVQNPPSRRGERKEP